MAAESGAWRGGSRADPGNQSRLEKVTAYQGEGAKVYQSAFRDDWRDPATGKTGSIYYMYEEYLGADAAKTFLAATLNASLKSGRHPTGERRRFTTWRREWSA